MRAVYKPPHYRLQTVGVIRAKDGMMAGLCGPDHHAADHIIEAGTPFEIDEHSFNNLVARYHGQFHAVVNTGPYPKELLDSFGKYEEERGDE